MNIPNLLLIAGTGNKSGKTTLACRVFFAKVTDNDLLAAFRDILHRIPEGTPIVCESPALRYNTEPGVLRNYEV